MNPEKIGRYEIKSELGRGGMATVYRGYDPRSEREVAIKVLPRELLHADPQFRLRFEREAKIIAQLEHPSIVPVYDVGEEDGQPFFVMRYMTGGDLSARIKQKSFSVEETIRILEQIAPGLDQAHAKGIVHRDLKPSNILFDNAGAPYISDFGIAKLSQGQGTNVTGSAIIGTPAYMAPEQAQGEKVDGRADLYAIGIILYEMLTGRQPYEADTPMAVVVKHITEPVPNILDVNPNLPSSIEAVIRRALAKNRDERYNTTRELLDALRRQDQIPTMQVPARDVKAQSGGTSAKTVLAAKHAPTVVPAAPATAAKSFNIMLVMIPVIALAILGLGGYLIFGNKPAKPAPTSSVATSSVVEKTEPPIATETNSPLGGGTPAPVIPTETATSVPPTETPTSIPQAPVIGGADRIAFLKGNDIWVMNMDGSDLRALTEDRTPKFNLQWLPDGKTLLYISGKTIKTVDIETAREEIITNFASAEHFDSFILSPDGKQVAISLARELHVVPFDLQRFTTITKKSDLLALKGCLFYNAVAIQQALWSKDGQKIAFKFLAPAGGVYADTVRLVGDVQSCDPNKLFRLDEFPAARFKFSAIMESLSWNGEALFLINSYVRNNGFGDLGLYNTDTHKFKKVYPIRGKCCYRDATFSPDGSYVLLAFQDMSLGEKSPIELYYISTGALETSGDLVPLPLPAGFYENLRDKPRPALRPAQK